MESHKIYYINSRNRISGNNNNFSYELPMPANSNFDMATVLQASIPSSYYLVQNGYNSFTVIENGIEYTVTIPEGNYNTKTFMTKALLELNNIGSSVYSMTFDNETAKYTIKITGNIDQPIFKFENKLYQLFGFERNSVNQFVNNALTSVNVVNFVPEGTLYIHSDLVAGDNNVLQEIYSNNTIPFSNITYQLSTDIEAYSKSLRNKDSNVFNFALLNEDDEELNLNGQNLLLTVLLYKKDTLSERFKKYISWVVQSSG